MPEINCSVIPQHDAIRNALLLQENLHRNLSHTNETTREDLFKLGGAGRNLIISWTFPETSLSQRTEDGIVDKTRLPAVLLQSREDLEPAAVFCQRSVAFQDALVKHANAV